MRRLLRQCRYRSVVRSVVRFTAEQKPNTAQNAVNTQLKRSMTATVSAKAARPASLRIARVLPPLVSARRASRATSRGPSESLRPSSAAPVPAFARTRPTSRIMGALAYCIANISEHDQIAGRSPGESGKTLRRSSDQPGAEAHGRAHHLRTGRIGSVDARGEQRINHDAAIARKFKEARGKFRIAGIEGVLDFG